MYFCAEGADFGEIQEVFADFRANSRDFWEIRMYFQILKNNTGASVLRDLGIFYPFISNTNSCLPNIGRNKLTQ